MLLVTPHYTSTVHPSAPASYLNHAYRQHMVFSCCTLAEFCGKRDSNSRKSFDMLETERQSHTERKEQEILCMRHISVSSHFGCVYAELADDIVT